MRVCDIVTGEAGRSIGDYAFCNVCFSDSPFGREAQPSTGPQSADAGKVESGEQRVEEGVRRKK